MKAILVHTIGGPEQMQVSEVPTPAPAAGQAQVKIDYSGVNFIDIYFRTGLYKADPPFTLGMEGAGTVTAIGDGVTEVAVGDRVAYAMQRGSYAEYAIVPSWQLVKLPDSVTTEQAAAGMLQGLTAHYLTHSTFPLAKEHTALVHAAAGGAGRLIVQMAKLRGARVIATVGSAAKAEVARAAGADHVINYTEAPDFDKEAKNLTGGKGVDVVYDSVGASTWDRSLDSLRIRGMMVTFGNASGPVAPIAPLLLLQKGSLFLTRPTLANYCSQRDELLWRAGELLNWIGSGAVKLHIDGVYPLADAGTAQTDLASRKTTGKLLLKP